MHKFFVIITAVFMIGCSGGETGGQQGAEQTTPTITLNVTAPEVMVVPERMKPSSDTDWAARVHNKNCEVIEVLNIINPVAAYLIEGFKQYGPKYSEGLHEEWVDTQVQLKLATDLYADCNKRMAAGVTDKKLFLDLEGTWQNLVKTGVAGIRAKAMMDDELKKIAAM